MDCKKKAVKRSREDFGKTLGAYSLMAAGASLAAGGSLLHAPFCHAASKCTWAPGAGIEIAPPSSEGTNIHGLDIDGDGINDVTFRATHNIIDTSTYMTTTGNTRRMFLDAPSQNVHQYIGTYVKRLNSGVSVVEEGKMLNNRRIMNINMTLIHTYSNWWGQWQKDDEGYIGVQFKIGENLHEGWILYKQGPEGGADFKGYIRAWGYDTDPGDTDLKTGECATVVELASFTASPGARRVALAWETASELDTAGYHVWRSETEGWGYARITKTLIPARGTPTQGATYAFEDRRLKPRRTYFYKLEDVDTSGNGTFHGPVSATPGHVRPFAR